MIAEASRAVASPLMLNQCLSGESSFPIDSRRTLEALRVALPNLPSDCWTLADLELGKALATILEIPIGDLVRRACTDFLAESEPQAQKKSDRENLRTLPFVDVALESTHRPKIKVYYGRMNVLTAEFEIKLAIELMSIELTFQGTRISRIRTGHSEGKMSVALMSTKPALTLATAAFMLPAEIIYSQAQN